MTVRSRVDKVYDDTLTAGQVKVDDLGLIPNGETWSIDVFGGSEAANGDGIASAIGLQHTTDNGSTWISVTKVWAIGDSPVQSVDRDFVGDGANIKIRIVRQNKSAVSKDVVARISGIKL